MRGSTAVGVLLTTVTVAILQTKVENVIGLNGSLFGSLIMFAIPGLMYLVYVLGGGFTVGLLRIWRESRERRLRRGLWCSSELLCVSRELSLVLRR